MSHTSRNFLEIFILAGGESQRFGGNDKAIQTLDDKPFLMHVVERCQPLHLPIHVVVHNASQGERLQQILPPSIPIIIDKIPLWSRTPLLGVLTAGEACNAPYLLVLPCDTIRLQPGLLEMIISFAKPPFQAVIPLWPGGWIEPLVAVYERGSLLRWIPTMFHAIPPQFRPRQLLSHLDHVKYLPVDELRERDPDLISFININSLMDLVSLEHLQDPYLQDT